MTTYADAARTPERRALEFVDEFYAVGGNGEGWTYSHLLAVVAWGLGTATADDLRLASQIVDTSVSTASPDRSAL